MCVLTRVKRTPSPLACLGLPQRSSSLHPRCSHCPEQTDRTGSPESETHHWNTPPPPNSSNGPFSADTTKWSERMVFIKRQSGTKTDANTNAITWSSSRAGVCTALSPPKSSLRNWSLSASPAVPSAADNYPPPESRRTPESKRGQENKPEKNNTLSAVKKRPPGPPLTTCVIFSTTRLTFARIPVPAF